MNEEIEEAVKGMTKIELKEGDEIMIDMNGVTLIATVSEKKGMPIKVRSKEAEG